MLVALLLGIVLVVAVVAFFAIAIVYARALDRM